MATSTLQYILGNTVIYTIHGSNIKCNKIIDIRVIKEVNGATSRLLSGHCL